MTDYFCYERLPTGNWSPVIYHGEMPKRSIIDRITTGPVALSEEDYAFFNEPKPFAMLSRKYPNPKKDL